VNQQSNISSLNDKHTVYVMSKMTNNVWLFLCSASFEFIHRFI